MPFLKPGTQVYLLIWYISLLLDPDPDPHSLYGSTTLPKGTVNFLNTFYVYDA